VADATASTRLLTDLGGHVLRPPHDSPHGRVATVADPEGAHFALIENPR